MGSKSIEVHQVPDPQILNPHDAVVKITRTAICGSDLHLYAGLIPSMESGDILGHEFMGIVEEVGSAVKTVHPGQFVVEQVWLANGFTAILVTHDVAEAREAASPSSARRQSAS